MVTATTQKPEIDDSTEKAECEYPLFTYEELIQERPVHNGWGIRLDKPNIIGFTGERGGGKTLSLARAGIMAMAMNRPVWANFKIEFNFRDRWGMVHHRVSRPLNLDKLYELDDEYRDGLVLIMEYQYYASSYASMSTRNRMLGAIWQQLRHRNLSFYWDAKSCAWIQNWDRFETDYEVFCQDAAFTPWGRNHHYKEGAVIFQRWFKRIHYPDGRIVKQEIGRRRIYAVPFHKAYRTDENVDVLDAMAPVKLAQNARHIGNGADDCAIDGIALTRVAQEKLQGNPYYPVTDFYLEHNINTRLQKATTRAILREAGIVQKVRDGMAVFMEE